LADIFITLVAFLASTFFSFLLLFIHIKIFNNKQFPSRLMKTSFLLYTFLVPLIPYIYLYRVLVKKLEGKMPLGTTSRRWEVNNLYLKEMRSKGCHWVHLVQDKDKWRALKNTINNEVYIVHSVRYNSVFTIFTKEGTQSSFDLQQYF
jgi:hypothetical protein